MMHTRKTIIRKACPNGHYVTLTRVQQNDETFYLIEMQDEEFDIDNEIDAQLEFERLVKVLAATPNWQAQADYDARWGEHYFPHSAEDY